MSIKNPKARTVGLESAYEIYQTADGQWTYYVLKHYKPELQEQSDPYASVYVHAFTPATSELGEKGDMYLAQVKTGTVLIDNPKCDYVCCCLDYDTSVEVVTRLNNYRYSQLRAKHPMLVNYIRVAVPKRKIRVFTHLANEYAMRIICTNAENEVALCLADLDTQRFKQIEADGGQLY